MLVLDSSLFAKIELHSNVDQVSCMLGKNNVIAATSTNQYK
jgi:hypothetical protein